MTGSSSCPAGQLRRQWLHSFHAIHYLQVTNHVLGCSAVDYDIQVWLRWTVSISNWVASPPQFLSYCCQQLTTVIWYSYAVIWCFISTFLFFNTIVEEEMTSFCKIEKALTSFWDLAGNSFPSLSFLTFQQPTNLLYSVFKLSFANRFHFSGIIS